MDSSNRKPDEALTYDELMDLLIREQQDNGGLRVKVELYRKSGIAQIIKAAHYCSYSMSIDGIATQGCTVEALEKYAEELQHPPK